MLDPVEDRPMFYHLVNRRPVPVDKIVDAAGALGWAALYQAEPRWVGRTAFQQTDPYVPDPLEGRLVVSSVFLGIDSAFFGPPQLFETMILGNQIHWQTRCPTWEQSERQHQEACDFLIAKGFKEIPCEWPK